MGINGDGSLTKRMTLTLTPKQDKFLSSKVKTGKYFTKQEYLRALISRDMEAVPA